MPVKRKRTPRELANDAGYTVATCKAEDIKNMNVNWLAQKMEVHASDLSRAFSQEKNIHPLEYLIAYKMQVAEELLRSYRKVPIKEIAEGLGYTPSHFTKVFKKHHFGELPSVFRTALSRYWKLLQAHLETTQKK